jgi:hypothetical protein
MIENSKQMIKKSEILSVTDSLRLKNYLKILNFSQNLIQNIDINKFPLGSVRLNEEISKIVYLDFYIQIKNRNRESFDGIIAQNKKEQIKSQILLESVFEKKPNNLSLVVLRPEANHLQFEFEKFISKKETLILGKKSQQISLCQYAQLYPDNLFQLENQLDFVTRTVTYLSSKLTAYLIFNPKSQQIDKGILGVYDNFSLRGKLLIGDYLNWNYPENPNLKILKKALDPFGMYKGIVDGTLPSDNFHREREYQWATYALQGFHIPEDSEFFEHLSVFLDYPSLTKAIKNYQILLKNI